MRSRDQVINELLVLAIQSGHSEAFARLASRWNPRLFRHAYRLTGDREGAREAVQDVWIAVARGINRLNDPARFSPWVLRIAARRCADWIRAQRRSRKRTAPVEEALEMPAARREEPERLVCAKEALTHLPRGYRELLSLYYVEGLTVAEIAEVLGVPRGTVKSRLYNGRERLRAALEVDDEERV